MPIRTIKLDSMLTREDRIRIWFMQLKLRLKKRAQERKEKPLDPKRFP